MKNLLICLMAFALTLGVACKKNEVAKPESSVSKKELSAKDLVRPNTSAIVDDTEILPNPGEGGSGPGGYPGGENVYPHNTGLCHCGVYIKCGFPFAVRKGHMRTCMATCQFIHPYPDYN